MKLQATSADRWNVRSCEPNGHAPGKRLLWLFLAMSLVVAWPVAAQAQPAQAQPAQAQPAQAQPEASKTDEEPKIPAKAYAQTYEQSFQKSGARPDGWNFTSRVSEELVQFEPKGLRIAMPPGGSAKPQSAGIVSSFGVQGDFEMTLGFRVFKQPNPADAGKSGTRLSLSVTLDTPTLDTPKAEVASLSRSLGGSGFVVWVRNRHEAAPLSYSFPMPAQNGSLRLVRSGDELYYLAATGRDQPLQFLKKYRFGADDVKRIGIVGTTGGEKAQLDVRVTNLRIRADAIPDAPASDALVPEDPEALAADGPGNGESKKVDANVDPAAPQRSSKVWLLAGLLVMLALLGVFTVAMLWRKRSSAVSQDAVAGGAGVSFACPECGTVLAAKAGLTGRKVKCPKCGGKAVVPAAAPGEP